MRGQGVSGIQVDDLRIMLIGIWIPATSYPAHCAGDAPGDSTRE
jgi:hypothetical protein